MHSRGNEIISSIYCMLMDTSRWTESIAQKVKRKKKASGVQRRKIWRSVFEPYIPPAFEDTGLVRFPNSKLETESDIYAR